MAQVAERAYLSNERAFDQSLLLGVAVRGLQELFADNLMEAEARRAVGGVRMAGQIPSSLRAYTATYIPSPPHAARRQDGTGTLVRTRPAR